MSEAAHKTAMNAPIKREQLHRIVDDSPALDDSAFGYWPAQWEREAAAAWDREQADTPLYTAEDMPGAVRWAIVVLCVLALLAAASPAFWGAF